MTGLRQPGQIYRADATDEDVAAFRDIVEALGFEEIDARPPRVSIRERASVCVHVDSSIPKEMNAMAESMKVLPGALKRLCLQIGLDAVRGRVDR